MIVAIRLTTAVNSQPCSASADRPAAVPPAATPKPAEAAADPVLCGHCGRTASNGLVCIGMCVADSGY
ncbi:MAG: hypothetical protein EB136_09850 [Synechococcaceae bacterium WBB_3_034]|nr:hypothetical protein [Synechococcaceae bacterium WBB_3_034]NDG22309.1 hypothetical protein [Synechococcaceae bacterium WBB_10_009]